MSAAEVLAQHQWRGDILGCGCRWNWPNERTYFCGEEERIQKAHIAHQLDALKAAGHAVVELFHPDDIVDDFVLHGQEIRHYAPNGYGAYQPFTLDEARHLSTALLSLLAVADAEEVS